MRGVEPNRFALKQMLLTEIATLDEVLNIHAAELGEDFTPYRNHTYRVVNLCVAQSSGAPEQLQKIAIAAAFHDIGIWTDGTFDYLPPSVRLASEYLVRSDRADWTAEISEMILQHHKILPYRNRPHWLVEPFRRSDWADVSRGVFAFGVSRTLFREIYERWPGAGFHQMLVRFELKHLCRQPWNPLPMLRL